MNKQALLTIQFWKDRVGPLHDKMIPCGLMLSVLFIFLATVTGAFDFNIHSPPWLSFKYKLLYSSMVIGSIEFITLLLTGLLLSVLLPLLRPVEASILTLVCAIPPVFITFSTPGRNALLPMEYSLLTILILYAINVLIGYFEETRSKQKIMDVFARYIPPQLAHELSKQSGAINLEGESKELTVLFSDLQDFTGVAEQLNPKQLVRLLNEYLTVMTGILYKHEATIDKYIGDSIMTFWGAPLPQKDHARRSIIAALEMHEELQLFSS